MHIKGFLAIDLGMKNNSILISHELFLLLKFNNIQFIFGYKMQ